MLNYINPKLVVESAKIEPGSITWKSPSNIAIVKYWGKYGQQLPRNPSISFTLENCYTTTTVEYQAKTKPDGQISLDFFFDGQPQEAFKKKTLQFLQSLTGIFPFLQQLHIAIKSNNSFPHSSGIASSASSMSALALCLCSLEHRLFQTLIEDQAFDQKTSYIARLGSGSACRSIYPLASMWGATIDLQGSSDEYAVPLAQQLHPIFTDFCDDILLVSKSEKKVSSRAGHSLMEGNPYAEVRYRQAGQNIYRLLRSLQTGDVETFGNITAQEALTLNALMMSSNPPYLLLQPATITLIRLIQEYRQSTRHPLYFSLDAGPNLHLLYPKAFRVEVQKFIRDHLSSWCENGEWKQDQMGPGPMEQ